MLAVFLFSLIGMPLTAGFAGKFLLFFGAFDVPAETPMRSMYRVLAVVAAVNAAVAAYYYLRVVATMYLRTSLLAAPRPAGPGYPVVACIAVCAAVTVALGVYPFPVLQAARTAFAAL